MLLAGSLVAAQVDAQRLSRRNAVVLKSSSVTNKETLLALNTSSPEITSSSLLLNRGVLNDTPAIAGYSISAEMNPDGEKSALFSSF